MVLPRAFCERPDKSRPLFEIRHALTYPVREYNPILNICSYYHIFIEREPVFPL